MYSLNLMRFMIRMLCMRCVCMEFIIAIRLTTVDSCSFALLVNFLDPIFPRFRGPFNLVFENNLLLVEPHKMFRVLSSIYLKPGE